MKGSTRCFNRADCHRTSVPGLSTSLCRTHATKSDIRFSQRYATIACCASELSGAQDSIFEDDGIDMVSIEACLSGLPSDPVAAAYATYSQDKSLQFVGITQNLALQLKEHSARVPENLLAFLRVRKIRDVSLASEDTMMQQARVWIDAAGGQLPPGNSEEAHIWGPPLSSETETESHGSIKTSPFTKATVHRQVGESSVKGNEMTVETVDKTLNDIRQYLFADGGDIRVIKVEDGNIYVQFEGACASCSSQEATMTMGVERALKAAFGEQLQEVIQIEDEEQKGAEEGQTMTVAAVDSLIALLRPAVANYGGGMEVQSVNGGICTIQYNGPDAIWTGVKMAIHDKFGDEVVDVVQA